MILMRNAVVWFLSFLLIMPPQWVLAADPIVIDTSAPGQNQAALAATPSGKTLLNIVAPNASGVSHNKFTDFNVTSSGLVINNATALATTHLAGVIEANPNFSGTAASLILNEVTSSNRSTLNGPTEIGGQAADYILANPNGITCNGCGFINTPRATLTTGTPTFTGNALTGLSVNAGDVVIEGLGLDATQADKFDIVTRATSINAQINAKDLGIHTGRQDFDYTARSGTAKVDDGSVKPTFAIDSTALGGMYAGRITLVGTEAGLGVRVAGDMAASTADMILTSDGKLELKSNLSAATTIQLTSTAADIVADKDVYAAGALTATASAGTVTASAGASFGAAGNVTVQAANVTAGTGGKFVSGMDGTGTLTTGGALDVQATTQISTGDGFLGGGASVFVKAPTVDLSRAADDNSETVRSRGTLTIESGNLTATNGRIASDGAMALKGNSPIVLGAGLYQSPTTITLTGDSVTSAATIVSDDQINITSTVGDITNTGSMTAGTTAALNSAANISNSGTIESQTGTTVTAAGTLTNASGAKIKSATTTSVTTGGTLTNAGSIFAVNAATLIAPTIDNTGSIAGSTNLDINVATLTNLNGVLHAQNNFTVTGYGGAANAVLFDNASGVVETVVGDITINAETIKNRKSVFTASSGLAAQGIAYEGGCAQYNSYPTSDQCLRSYYNANTPIGSYAINDWSNYGGLAWFYYAGTISANSAAGSVSSGRNILLTGTTVSNDYSTISAVGNIGIQTTTFNNQAAFTYGEVYFDRPQYTHLLLARQSTGSELALVRAGGNLNITATGGVRNSTEQFNTSPPSNVTNVNTADLAVAPAASNLINTTQYVDLIPGRDALFVASANPTATFVFETRVDFITVANYFGSDYFLSKLDVTPEQISTRLGDAYFDTTLVREAILRETGRRWLDTTVQDDIQQMKRLLDNGAQATNDLQLAFGVTLTAAQINALTSDIVVYVEETYQGRTVLVPKVYLASATRAKIDPNGAILTGDNVTIAATDITNDRGRIKADNDVTLTASTGDISTIVGEITAAKALTMTAGGDITATGTAITAGQNATLNATGDITIASLETRHKNVSSVAYSDEVKNIASTVKVGGNLNITSGGDTRVKGSQIQADGDVTLVATGNVTIESSTDTLDAEGKGRLGKTDQVHSVTQNASTLTSGGKLSVTSGGTARIKGSKLTAANDLELQATGDVVIESSADSSQMEVTAYKLNTITQKSAELTAGGDVTLGSLVGDMSIIASNIDSGGAITLNTPGGTLYLGARKDYREEHISDSKSGAFITTYSNRGTIDETVVPTLLTASGNIAIVTGDGVIVDYKDTGSFTDSIDQLSQAPGLAWMADLRARNDVSWNAVQEAHESWDYRSQGISPTGAALISLAVGWAMGPAGFMTDGVGATVTGATTELGAAVANAGFSSLVSQAATALVGNGGDIGAALKQLGSGSTLKNLATAMITAGLLESLPVDTLGLDASKTAPFVEKLKYNIATASISATVDSVINGTPLTENLKNGLVNAAFTVVSQTAFKTIGDIGIAQSLPPGSLQKIALHALAGCALGQANSINCAAGAMAAGLQEALGEQFATLTDDPANQAKLAGLVGAMAVVVTGGDASAISTASVIAQTANSFNRQLHTKEIQAIKTKAAEMDGEDGKNAAEWEKLLGNEAIRLADERLGSNIAPNENEMINTALAELRSTYGADFIADVGQTYSFLERDSHFQDSTTFSYGLVQDKAFYDNVLSGWAEQVYGGPLPDGIGASQLALVETSKKGFGCGSGFESCAGDYSKELELLNPTQGAVTNAIELAVIRDELANTWIDLQKARATKQADYDHLKAQFASGEPTVTQAQVNQAYLAYQQADAATAASFQAAESSVEVASGLVSDASVRKVITDGNQALEDFIKGIPDLPQSTLETLVIASRGANALSMAALGDEEAQSYLSGRVGEIWEALKSIQDLPDSVREDLNRADALYKAGDFDSAGKIYGDIAATASGIVIGTVSPNKSTVVAKALKGLASLKAVVKIKNLLSRVTAVDAKIKWGGDIQEQGLPYETFLANTREKVGKRLPPGYPKIDFFNKETRTITSAKTINTQTAARLQNPQQIEYLMRQQVRDLKAFSGSDYSQELIQSTDFDTRRLEIAVPYNTTTQQWHYIERAVQYANENGVEIVITKVK